MTDGPARQGEGVFRPHGFNKQEKVQLRRQNIKYKIQIRISVQLSALKDQIWHQFLAYSGKRKTCTTFGWYSKIKLNL